MEASFMLMSLKRTLLFFLWHQEKKQFLYYANRILKHTFYNLLSIELSHLDVKKLYDRADIFLKFRIRFRKRGNGCCDLDSYADDKGNCGETKVALWAILNSPHVSGLRYLNAKTLALVYPRRKNLSRLTTMRCYLF